jgi:hypothetical protein
MNDPAENTPSHTDAVTARRSTFEEQAKAALAARFKEAEMTVTYQPGAIPGQGNFALAMNDLKDVEHVVKALKLGKPNSSITVTAVEWTVPADIMKSVIPKIDEMFTYKIAPLFIVEAERRGFDNFKTATIERDNHIPGIFNYVIKSISGDPSRTGFFNSVSADKVSNQVKRTPKGFLLSIQESFLAKTLGIKTPDLP